MVEEWDLKELEREWVAEGWMDSHEDEKLGLVEELRGWWNERGMEHLRQGRAVEVGSKRVNVRLLWVETRKNSFYKLDICVIDTHDCHLCSLITFGIWCITKEDI